MSRCPASSDDTPVGRSGSYDQGGETAWLIANAEVAVGVDGDQWLQDRAQSVSLTSGNHQAPAVMIDQLVPGLEPELAGSLPPMDLRHLPGHLSDHIGEVAGCRPRRPIEPVDLPIQRSEMSPWMSVGHLEHDREPRVIECRSQERLDVGD